LLRGEKAGPAPPNQETRTQREKGNVRESKSSAPARWGEAGGIGGRSVPGSKKSKTHTT